MKQKPPQISKGTGLDPSINFPSHSQGVKLEGARSDCRQRMYIVHFNCLPVYLVCLTVWLAHPSSLLSAGCLSVQYRALLL